MDQSEALEQLLLDSRDSQLLIRTDGNGNVVRARGQGTEDRAALAESVDLALAAISTFAKRLDTGSFQTAVLMYERGTVFCGHLPTGGAIALVAASGANLGLLLNQVRRLLSEESGRADYAS